MGKKQIKKNLKKHEQTIKTNEKLGGLHHDIKKFIIIFSVVLIVIGAGYGVLYKLYAPDKPEEADKVEEVDVLEGHKILAQDAFSMTGDYYVIFINDEEGKDIAEQYFTLNQDGASRGYYVDMNDPLNKNYAYDDTKHKEKYGEYKPVEYNKNPANSSELQIYEYPTVIQVSNGALVGYYENDEVYAPLGIPNPNEQQVQ